MAVIRILVDGYSLLHQWTEIAPGKPRFSAAARDELIRRLTLYRDSIGTPITIVFDGAGQTVETSQFPSTPELEIVYSRSGQTADQVIERVAALMQPFGEVLAVTDDNAERDTVLSLGGMASSCLNFINEVENTLADFQRDMKKYNRTEKDRFKQRK
ncbi:MAG: NYN domain-containing protein [Verrucomicrobia bacterium]|nr:NYN domain-containing protein [Verrucomicrobiota bacterium]